MPRKKYLAEAIVSKLRQADVLWRRGTRFQTPFGYGESDL